jgi:hypothetical protein
MSFPHRQNPEKRSNTGFRIKSGMTRLENHITFKAHKESEMHVDESKKFDKRNVERNIKNGTITHKEYETYLSRLPDVSEKMFSTEEDMVDAEEFGSSTENQISFHKKGTKKKARAR